MRPSYFHYRNYCTSNTVIFILREPSDGLGMATVCTNTWQTKLDSPLVMSEYWYGRPCYSLWPSDVIWRHRSGSTLAQVMAWRCQNQYLLVINGVLWHLKSQIYLTKSIQEALKISILKMSLKIMLSKFLPHFPEVNESIHWLLAFTSHEGNFPGNTYEYHFCKMSLKMTFSKLLPHLPGASEVKCEPNTELMQMCHIDVSHDIGIVLDMGWRLLKICSLISS